MKSTSIITTVLASGLLSTSALSAELKLSMSYTDALTGKSHNLTKRTSVDTASGRVQRSDRGIEKTILVSNLANTFERVLKNFTLLTTRGNSTAEHDKLIKRELSESLLRELSFISERARLLNITDKTLEKYLKLGVKLSENIKKENQVYYTQQQQQQQGQLNVTAGGAQSADFFLSVIEAGKVPAMSTFTIEGFLSDFDLSLENVRNCGEVFCINPEYKFVPETKKLYVQLAMGTKYKLDTFKRKDVNLSVVLDVSGSMGAIDDSTMSRLEWAKKSLVKTIEKLGPNDTLSIVLFDHTSRVLLPPTKVFYKDELIKMVDSIGLGGNTNIAAGLIDGHSLVSDHFNKNSENRVILITDAGVNTGMRDDKEFETLVSTYARMGISLTTIGVGENFRQELVHTMSLTKGANYIFVQSAKSLVNYVNQFNFLVSPIVYDFKAELGLGELEGTLVKAYGLPKKMDSKLQEILDIRTLFLTTRDNGGAILLEYDLE